MANFFADAVRFLATSSGTGSFVVNSAVQGFRTPASASVPNGATFAYRAESSDLSQWEEGIGLYTSGTMTLARTTITSNSSSNTSAINFSAAPQVALVLASADILNLVAYFTQSPNSTQQAQAIANLGIGAWAGFTPTVSSLTGAFTSASATGRFLKVGKIVFCWVAVTITTNGTAAGGVQCTVPFTSQSGNFVFVGRDNGVTGNLLTASLASTTSLFIQNYNGTYAGANGAILVTSGVYEAA